MKKLFFIALALLSAASCSFIEDMDSQPELTSPCVGLDGSPCGPKRPVNLWLYDGSSPEESFPS